MKPLYFRCPMADNKNMTTNLTPAAKRELTNAADNQGWTGASLRNGPRMQLIEAGLAAPIMQTNGQPSWDLRLTEAGWEAARRGTR